MGYVVWRDEACVEMRENEEAPESDSAFDRLPAHDVSINSHRLYTFLLLFTSLSFVTDYRIMQNISCNLSRIIHACFFLCSHSFLLCSLSLPFSPFFSPSFHSIVTKYRYIEYKVRIWIEKSVFFFRFRFVKFEIFFKFGIYPFIHFIFFSLSTSRFIRNFIIYIFIIYILIINFIFFLKIDKNRNYSQFHCLLFSLSFSLSRDKKWAERQKPWREFSFHFDEGGRERGRDFFHRGNTQNKTHRNPREIIATARALQPPHFASLCPLYYPTS